MPAEPHASPPRSLTIAGLMSGTSADGIDVALCRINGAPPRLSAQIIAAHTVPYAPPLRERILRACEPPHSPVDSLCLLNVELADAFADAILRLIADAELSAAEVDLIASHGQTVWHAVDDAGQVQATLQIGEASVLAERTGITVIDNFRARDVAAGGQGAPLTGYVDWLLLRHEREWRAVQNIGGMGNVSFLPPLSDTDSPLLAFDTGPGNALIDSAVQLLTDGAQTYDRDGALARAGRVNGAWLKSLMDHPYYERQPPKTTGRELFGTPAARALVEQARAEGLPPADIVATLTALTAHSIADAYRRFAPASVAEVIVGGGGRLNPALLDMLTAALAPARVIAHEQTGIDGDFKEALVFAVLGYETWHNRPGTLPAQTGARQASVLGQITPGDNYAALIRRTWGGA